MLDLSSRSEQNSKTPSNLHPSETCWLPVPSYTYNCSCDREKIIEPSHLLKKTLKKNHGIPGIKQKISKELHKAYHPHRHKIMADMAASHDAGPQEAQRGAARLHFCQPRGHVEVSQKNEALTVRHMENHNV